MGMQVAEHKGIRWKLMNRAVIFHKRVIPDIAGRTREPVSRFVQSQPLADAAVNHIVHISGKGNGASRKKTAKHRCNLAFIAALFPDAVARTRLCQMVGLLYIREGNLRQKYGIELAAVIVVNTASAVPEILCRNGGAAHHGLHKTIIHEFFGSVCLRVKARKIGPEKEKGEKQHFFHHQEVDFRRMDAYLKASENPRSQDQYTDCDQADRCGKRNQSEASKSKYSKTGNNDAKHFRKHPSPVMKPRKQSNTEHQGHKPPLQERNVVRSKKRRCGQHKQHQQNAGNCRLFAHL